MFKGNSSWFNLIFVFILLFCFDIFAKQVYVKSYTRKNGTRVSGHYRNYNPGVTYVKPYHRKDGTFVKGHYRGLGASTGSSRSYNSNNNLGFTKTPFKKSTRRFSSNSGIYFYQNNEKVVTYQFIYVNSAPVNSDY